MGDVPSSPRIKESKNQDLINAVSDEIAAALSEITNKDQNPRGQHGQKAAAMALKRLEKQYPKLAEIRVSNGRFIPFEYDY